MNQHLISPTVRTFFYFSVNLDTGTEPAAFTLETTGCTRPAVPMPEASSQIFHPEGSHFADTGWDLTWKSFPSKDPWGILVSSLEPLG